jgi:hypothetical protein
MIVQYVVEWIDRGYYAKHQPTYEWCFTNDIQKAAAYKSLKSAEQRAFGDRFGMGHSMKPYRLVKVDGNHVILEEPGGFITPSVQQQLKKQEKDPEITLASLKGKK